MKNPCLLLLFLLFGCNVGNTDATIIKNALLVNSCASPMNAVSVIPVDVVIVSFSEISIDEAFRSINKPTLSDIEKDMFRADFINFRMNNEKMYMVNAAMRYKTDAGLRPVHGDYIVTGNGFTYCLK